MAIAVAMLNEAHGAFDLRVQHYLEADDSGLDSEKYGNWQGDLNIVVLYRTLPDAGTPRTHAPKPYSYPVLSERFTRK
jgi:hypothetical protein